MSDIFDQLTEKFTDNEDFKKRRELEALRNLCYQVCSDIYGAPVYNSLARGGITSIRALYETDIDDIAKIRNMGKIRMHWVKELRNVIQKELRTMKF